MMQVKATGPQPWRTQQRLQASLASRWMLAALLLAPGTITVAQADGDPRIAASREYAARLQQELGARLKDALAESGPAGAIAVCQVEAPRIAQELAGLGGPIRVGRTALRVRNPANAPDEAARAVMERFEQAVAQGEEGHLTDFATRPDGSARYMRAIVMQPLCLACHGPALAPEVEVAIAHDYPDDQATGFAEGDLRGAFMIEWPASVSYHD